jgi:predicted nucleic acid-binding protein
MMVYLDTSVFLKILLKAPDAIKLKSDLAFISSELFTIEVNRTLDRIRLENQISDLKLAELKVTAKEFIESLRIVRLTESIKKRAAGAFPTIIRTLDGMHIATAVLLKEKRYPQLKLCTQDDQMARCAAALGFELVTR